MNNYKQNNFFFGFICCFSMFLFMGLTQSSNRYKDENEIYREFQNIYLNVQPKKFRIQTTTPTVSDIKEGEMILVQTGEMMRLFTKNDKNELWRSTFTRY